MAMPADDRFAQPEGSGRKPRSKSERELERDGQFATTLARGLEILRCFTPEHPIIGNRELSDRTGLSKPTISRLTYTLVKLGYLQVEPHSGKYQLGTAVLTLSYPLLANIPLRQLVRLPMRSLADEIGGSVSLGMRSQLSIVYVETSRSRSFQSPQFSDIGMSHPIIATANGRAYLAGCSPEYRETLLNEIKVKTPEAGGATARAPWRASRNGRSGDFVIPTGSTGPMCAPSASRTARVRSASCSCSTASCTRTRSRRDSLKRKLVLACSGW